MVYLLSVCLEGCAFFFTYARQPAGWIVPSLVQGFLGTFFCVSLPRNARPHLKSSESYSPAFSASATKSS